MDVEDGGGGGGGNSGTLDKQDSFSAKQWRISSLQRQNGPLYPRFSNVCVCVWWGGGGGGGGAMYY